MSQVSDSDTNQQQEGGDTLDDFDAAMSELTASSDQAPADDAAAEDQDDPDQGSKAAEDQPGSSTEEAGKNDQAAGSQPPAQTQSDDIWANAPPELRNAYERERANWNHRLSSTQGRLSVADRELARLRREAQSSGGDEGSRQGNRPPLNAFQSEDVQRAREDYSEVVEPLATATEQAFQEVSTRIDEFTPELELLRQERAQRGLDQKIGILENAHPDWREFGENGKQTQAFMEWVYSQPQAIQDAYDRANVLADGHEAAWLLSQFKASLGVTSSAPPASQSSGNGNQQPATDPRRARQLAAGRDGGSTSPPTTSAVPDDFDGALDAIIAQRDRQSRQTGQYR